MLVLSKFSLNEVAFKESEQNVDKYKWGEKSHPRKKGKETKKTKTSCYFLYPDAKVSIKRERFVTLANVFLKEKKNLLVFSVIWSLIDRAPL